MKGLPRTIALALLAALIPACGDPPRILLIVPPVNGIPVAALASFTGTQSGVISIAYTLVDAESNPVAVVVEFSLDTGTSYSPATRAPGGEGSTGLLSTPAGSPHTFLWDSVADGVGRGAPATGVLIRITPSDADPGSPVSTSLTVDNQPTVFRMDSISLRDPHVWFSLPMIVPCTDITDTTPGGVNTLLNTALTTDGNGDGFLDASPLLLFRMFDPLALAGKVEFAAGRCNAAGTSCDLAPSATRVSATYTQPASGTLVPIASTTSGYTPAVASPSAPGFVSDPVQYTLNLGTLILPLEGFRVAANYSGTPTNSLTSGLAMGFLPKSVADLTTISLGAPLGTLTLSSLLGGGGLCGSVGDLDTGPDGSTPGWWFYFNFTAVQTPYTGP